MKPTIQAQRPNPNQVTVDVHYDNGRHTRYSGLDRMQYPSLWLAAKRAGMSTGRVLALLRRAAAGCPGLRVRVLEEGASTVGQAARDREADLHTDPGSAAMFRAELERLKGTPCKDTPYGTHGES